MNDLPLIQIQPAPSMRKDSRAEGKTTDSPTPFKLPELEMGPSQGPSGRGSRGILDSVLFALTGTPDSIIAPEDMKDRVKRRKDAGSQAAAAANGELGDSYMSAPGTGGSGFGIGDVISLVSKML